jgi:DNA-binding LytR/AlgR family response regulator
MLNIAIVEDSPKDLSALKNILKRYEADTGIRIGTISEFDRGETFLQNYKPIYDIVFMDIMLPYMTGMDTAKALRKIDEEVSLIFVTDMKQFAIEGYRVNASDYFVKPASYFDVKLRLDKLQVKKENRLPTVVIHIPGEGDKVFTSQEVYYIEIMNKDLTYHTVRGNYSTRNVSLKKLEDKLAESGFCRCSSSFLVNLRHCKELRAEEVVVGRDTLKISRGMRSEFVTRLSESVSHWS